MKTSNKHPIIMIREKTQEDTIIYDSTQLSSSYEEYEASLLEFQDYCTRLYDILHELSNSLEDSALKDSNYLRSKTKKCNPNIELRKLESGHELLHVIKNRYEELQKIVLKNRELFVNNYEASEMSSRKALKTFYERRPNLIAMTYITNNLIYEKAIQYIEGRFDQRVRNLRKIEMPLLKIATKATTKTSPLWFHNKVSAISPNLMDFEFKINKPLITPNYVFFQRVFEKLIFWPHNLPLIEFELSKKMTESNGYIYVFRNDSDNYKIHRAKDVLAKVPVNPFFEKVIKCKAHVITTEFISNTFEMNDETAQKLLKKMFELGLINLSTELDEGFYTIRNFQRFIKSLPKHDYNSKLIIYLEELSNLLVVLNREFNVNTLEDIYKMYDVLCDYIGIEKIEKKIMLYGDYVDSKPSKSVDEAEVALSDNITNLLEVFPIFDINQMIKYEFVDQMKNITGQTSLPMEHPLLMKILTDVNLQYASYWTQPWGDIESKAPKNLLIKKLKAEFIEWLFNRQNDEVVEIEEIVTKLSADIKKNGLGSHGYYTLFYQKESEQTIINKTYPGYGSFYQRFLRYTDIAEKYGNEINDFYKKEQWRYAEILETLGFNANVTNQPYFKDRYRDRESRGDFYDRYFDKVFDETDAEIRFEDNELFVCYPDGQKLKPVIASSLVRALYPGRLAFISSLFTNISFISDMAILFLNWNDANIKRTPRIVYKDIIIERSGVLIECSQFNELFDSEELKQYQLIRRFIQLHVGEQFYYHLRKNGIGPISAIATEFSKPQYCDMNNVLHYKLLLNSIKGTVQILFREAIPKDYSVAEYAQEVYVNGK